MTASRALATVGDAPRRYARAARLSLTVILILSSHPIQLPRFAFFRFLLVPIRRIWLRHHRLYSYVCPSPRNFKA
jgi:hypothetical protein